MLIPFIQAPGDDAPQPATLTMLMPDDNDIYDPGEDTTRLCAYGDRLIDQMIANGACIIEDIVFTAIGMDMFRMNNGYCTRSGMDKYLKYIGDCVI